MLTPMNKETMRPTITRRHMLKLAIGTAAAATLQSPAAFAQASPGSLSSRRPLVQDRKFHSPAVETYLLNMRPRIGDPDLAWLFENCYPNTLDTTVEMGTFEGKPDTAVI